MHYHAILLSIQSIRSRSIEQPIPCIDIWGPFGTGWAHPVPSQLSKVGPRREGSRGAVAGSGGCANLAPMRFFARFSSAGGEGRRGLLAGEGLMIQGVHISSPIFPPISREAEKSQTLTWKIVIGKNRKGEFPLHILDLHPLLQPKIQTVLHM